MKNEDENEDFDENDGFEKTREKFLLNKDKFPEEFVNQFEWFMEFHDYWQNVFQKCLAEMTPQLHAVMLRQFPEFASLSHPSQLKFIKTNNEGACIALIPVLSNLCKKYQAGEDIRKENPKIDEWREFYCNPQQPFKLKESDKEHYMLMSEGEDWETIQKNENREMLRYHLWKEKRMTEFYDVVQPLLFKYLPALNEIEGDYWVMYAMYIGDAYENWKSLHEELEVALDYGMPPESMDLDGKEFQKLFSVYYKKNPNAGEEKRNEKIRRETVLEGDDEG